MRLLRKVDDHDDDVPTYAAPRNGPRSLIEHLWALDEVAERYRTFVADYSALGNGPTLGEREAFIWCTKMIHDFRWFAMIDPELPDTVARHAAARREAIAVFEASYSRLREPAATHFRALTRSAEPA